MDMSVQIGNVLFKNPVLTASGTAGYGEELEKIFNLDLLGGFVVKGLHWKPHLGNPPQRMFETPSGILNSIGLQGIGVQSFKNKHLNRLKKYNIPIIVNIWGQNIFDYEKIIQILEPIDHISGFEVNVSCPNFEKKGVFSFGLNPLLLAQLIQAIRKKTSKLIIVKLSPNSENISKLAKIAENEGADSVSLVNTFLAMSIDVHSRKPRLAHGLGGLSGPAIRPIAVRMVWEVAQVVNIPVIGIGGILTASDALEFIIAGASAVQIGSAHFNDPSASLKIIQNLKKYCVKNQILDFKTLIGSLNFG